MVKFHCNAGHMMIGHPVSTCRLDKSWSSPMPRCVRACTYPGGLISGQIIGVVKVCANQLYAVAWCLWIAMLYYTKYSTTNLLGSHCCLTKIALANRNKHWPNSDVRIFLHEAKPTGLSAILSVCVISGTRGVWKPGDVTFGKWLYNTRNVGL